VLLGNASKRILFHVSCQPEKVKEETVKEKSPPEAEGLSCNKMDE
jgi:hypothetical protein